MLSVNAVLYKNYTALETQSENYLGSMTLTVFSIWHWWLCFKYTETEHDDVAIQTILVYC